MMRPNTLAVATRDRKNLDTKQFIRDTLNAWHSKAQCNIVPAEKLIELFEVLRFSPTEKQINEMLQTAKLFARRGTSNLDGSTGSFKSMNGLTFGEFCILAADLKRFRTQTLLLNRQDTDDDINNGQTTNSFLEIDDRLPSSSSSSISPVKNNSQTKVAETQNNSDLKIKDELKPTDNSVPEVFLGGSCNPTTWRADVAIPALNKLGISFYNPQVSDWTPDLIELEHRAKEKARVLFFVMDSETRASAGAIEAAHIAGQNSKHLVLVLHPYKPDQSILNEPISAQEYMDLRRNQQLLREMVTRRGIPVLDNIPSGLQKTKGILAGSYGRELPHNIASRLIAIRHAFDRVLDKNQLPDGNERITLEQCQSALNFLGYAQNLLRSDNLVEIIASNREISEKCQGSEEKAEDQSSNSQTKKNNLSDITIDFQEFCTLIAFLTVLQQEINESGCVSPIKGTNLPPPPIFLTNAPEWLSNHQGNFGDAFVTMQTKHTIRSSSSKSVPDERGGVNTTFTTIITDKYRNRDSGTSSPQPNEHRTSFTISTSSNDTASSSNSANSNEDESKVPQTDGKMKISLNVEYFASNKKEKVILDEELSDSNDSVFSSASSVDSILNCGTQESFDSETNGIDWDLRDVYLGGSCMLRTPWRKDVVIPILEANGISYHLPQLHESIYHERNGESRTLPTPFALLSTKRNKKSTGIYRQIEDANGSTTITTTITTRKSLYNPTILESSRVLLFIITNETRSLAPMTLAAHSIGLGFNVVLCVQMLTENCVIGDDKLTPAAIKDYNRGRSYLIDLAKRQDVPVFNGIKEAVECAIEKVKMCKSRTIL